MGISDTASEGIWISEQTNEKVAYTRWADNEPNSGTADEDCVDMLINTGHWNDRECHEKFNFVCKKGEETNGTKGQTFYHYTFFFINNSVA